ncbi:MAG: NAD(+)/NADH kinase [Candidatus Peregrinibacteria bacterium]|nr:NAD(+)/NADH kinase [Candidatus Peregrinibacteria bacterium]MCB9808471.1 NAD(+)/NADH kinase [Candidatus Peribacteria bacterium]
MLIYKRIGVTVKSGLSYRHEAVSTVLGILDTLGADVRIDEQRMSDVPEAKQYEVYDYSSDVDLLLVIGGDGTILRAVRELQNFEIPIFSINKGTVGFLAEAELDEAEQIVPQVLSGGGTIEHRSILHVRGIRDGTEFVSGFALNEAVIAQGTIARLVDLQTTVNGEPLTTFNADGLIVSTPTGSTAYSLAAGGPIVHPTLNATILTPINPHSFGQKPIVIPSTYDVTITVSAPHNKFRDTEVVLTMDGQKYVPLQDKDEIHCFGCPQTVKFLRRSEDTFFHTLRKKLHWGEHLQSL